jgi:hypothetical protein
MLETLANTGVQTNIIYSSVIDTTYFFDFSEDPKPKTLKNKYVAPTSFKVKNGDGAVLTTSALIAPIKWADDFKNKVANSKPVNMIELCSTYKRRTSVFTPGFLDVKDNAYFGMECDCAGTKILPKDGSKCMHTYMVTDAKLIKFVMASAADGVVAKENTASKTFFEKSES